MVHLPTFTININQMLVNIPVPWILWVYCLQIIASVFKMCRLFFLETSNKHGLLRIHPFLKFLTKRNPNMTADILKPDSFRECDPFVGIPWWLPKCYKVGPY